MTRFVVVVVVLATTACTNLPDLGASPICGNFVLEEGEDCDGDPSGLCDDTCALRCALDGVGDPCPMGYSCGVDDHLCHAPSGAFDPAPSLIPMGSLEYRISDVNGDGRGDVITVSESSLIVNYGDRSATLATGMSTLIPKLRGFPVFAQLDEAVGTSGSVDVIGPTSDGLVAYSSPHQVMSPHAFALSLVPKSTCTTAKPGQPFRVVTLDDQHLGLLVRLEDDPFTMADEAGRLGFAVIDIANKDSCPSQPVALPCPSFKIPTVAQQQLGAPVLTDIYRNSTATQLSTLVALVSTLPVQGGSCVIQVTRSALAPGPYAVTTIGPAAPGIQGQPVLADLDGGGCPSLINSDAGTALTELKGTGSPGACAIAGLPAVALPALPNAPVGSSGIGHLRLNPVAFTASNQALGKDAIVMTFGVYGITPSRAVAAELYHSDRQLVTVLEGDIDHDGDLDGVAISANNDDLDVLTRTQNTFLLYRLDTAGPVGNFVVADFDGNGVDDVAYGEVTSTSERLMLAYGTHDGLSPPVSAGSFSRIVGLCPVEAVDSLDPHQLVADLVVLDLLPQTTEPLLTLLHGSPQRSMLSFFDPHPVTIGLTEPFVGVAAGNFFSPTGGPYAVPATDLLAISISTTPSATAHLWNIQGTSPGSVEAPTTFDPEITMLGDCGLTQSAEFCVDSAQYVTWPQRAGHDVVIGIDRGRATGPPSRNLAVIDPSPFAPPQATIRVVHDVANPFHAIDSALIVRSAHPIDVTGDGVLDLVVSFGAPKVVGPDPRSKVLLCQVTDAGLPTSCDDVTTLVPELADMTCGDAAPARVRPHHPFDDPALRLSTDLAVVCRPSNPGAGKLLNTVFRLFHDADGFHVTGLFHLEFRGTIERLEIGDVNGDGIDDAVALIYEDGAPLPELVILPQCTSHDGLCIGAAVP